jgi:hypothetical protein
MDQALFSHEGTTQGDLLAMPMYAIALLPLIEKVNPDQSLKQSWYADDASAAGSKSLRGVQCPCHSWERICCDTGVT